MAGGHLRERLKFQKRMEANDGFGNTVSSWVDQFTADARVRPRMGSEPIIAQRLQGVQPVTITVRSSYDTRQITPAWRAVDSRNPAKIYDIKTAVADERNRYIELMAEDGPAT